jgi:ComF family protein
MKIHKYLLEMLDSLGTLVFPNYCPECGAGLTHKCNYLCEDCWENLPPGRSDNPIRDNRLKQRLFVAYSYADTMRTIIHQMKFQGRKDLAGLLTEKALARFTEEVPMEISAVVPVPLHPVRVRERGYDQNLIMAQTAANLLGVDIQTDWLKRKYNTMPQSRLSDKARRKNLEQAIIAKHHHIEPPEQPVLLIDDVIHTGTTVCACMTALSQMGVSETFVLSICG